MVNTDLRPIQDAVTVDAPAEEVFKRFVESFGRWWPIAYSWGESEFATAVIEPQAGGRWYETLNDGTEKDWGEVRAFEPGSRLILSFNISPERTPEPPERQSEVEFRFISESGKTRVELEHRDLGKHGKNAERLRQGLESPQGWPLILASFAREIRYPA